jgi:hypothetical protein
MKRIITALAGGAVVATVAFASASALTVDAGTIQAGGGSVTCDTDGVKANWGLETDDNSVRFVRVSGIDEACEGAKIFVKVDGGPTRNAVIDGEQTIISFPAPYLVPEDIENVRIWIAG